MSIVFFVVSFMGFFLFQDRLDRKCTSRVTSYSILGVRDMILAKGGVEGFGQNVCVWPITCKDKVDQGMCSKPPLPTDLCTILCRITISDAFFMKYIAFLNEVALLLHPHLHCKRKC